MNYFPGDKNSIILLWQMPHDCLYKRRAPTGKKVKGDTLGTGCYLPSGEWTGFGKARMYPVGVVLQKDLLGALDLKLI